MTLCNKDSRGQACLAGRQGRQGLEGKIKIKEIRIYFFESVSLSISSVINVFHLNP
jgi:hypothetical protein